MSLCLRPQGVPFAVPFALSHDCYAPLWDRAFRRITPGALSAVRVLLMFPAGGWS